MKCLLCSKKAMHAVHRMRRGDVTFSETSVQLLPEQWHLADRVEVRFRSSKGEQLRKGAALVSERRGPPRLVEEGGARWGVMVELLSYSPSLPYHAPLATVDVGGGR